MSRQRRRDTQPELALRRHLHALGLRYRVEARPLPSVRITADIVFGPAKVAVFVDGCFWHVCPMHATFPRANRSWWNEKLERNIERDRRNDRTLINAGWLPVHVWEHEDPEEVAYRIATLVKMRRDGVRGST
jgi:DNA mismatch endonuclease (patch repair protein)